MHNQNAMSRLPLNTQTICRSMVHFRLLLLCCDFVFVSEESGLGSLLSDTRSLCLPGLLASSLLSVLDVSSAGTAAAETGLNQPSDDR